MVREQKIERLINQAIDNCNNSLKEVKNILKKAIKELNKVKIKKIKKNTNNQLSNFKLQNLTIKQRDNVIEEIEKMIQVEKNFTETN